MLSSLGSFRARLIASATIWIVLGLSGSWLLLREIMHRHVASELRDELYHHSAELENILGLDANGRLILRQPLSDHRFFAPNSGQYWQVERGNGEILASQSLGQARLTLDRRMPFGATGEVRDLASPTGNAHVLERLIRPAGLDESLRLGIGIDDRMVDELMSPFDNVVSLTVGIIGLGLIAAVFGQVTYGLWPVARLREAMAAIREGKADQLPDGLPREVQPLADSLNEALLFNEALIRRAHSHARDMAEELQAPLAILIKEGRRLESLGQSRGVVLREAERMQRLIEHQVAQAGVGAPHAGIVENEAPASSVL